MRLARIISPRCVPDRVSALDRYLGKFFMSLRRRLTLSQHPIARTLRVSYRALTRFSLPAPKVVVKPMLWAFLTIRTIYYFAVRTLVCEPLFKAYCTQYGRGLRTGVFVHWVNGGGRIILGDHVLVDGLCAFTFTQRHIDEPTLEIGDFSELGHGCSFTIGKKITIGQHTRIAMNCLLFDTGGHPLDAEARRAHQPAPTQEVRPIVIGDDVWIGQRSIIMPGTRIGDGAIISAGSIVRGTVAPYTLVAGSPARVVVPIPRQSTTASAPTGGKSVELTRSHDDTTDAAPSDRSDRQR